MAQAPASPVSRAAISQPDPTPVRCKWAGDDPLMRAYHDEEWGIAQHDPRMLWEMLMLEGFQAGDRKSTRLNSSHIQKSRMPSSA